jgi:hypothetical protein
VDGSTDSNAHASIDKTASHGVWLLPFVGEFKQLLGFPSNQSISGDDKRHEVSMLNKTGIETLSLFKTIVVAWGIPRQQDKS